MASFTFPDMPTPSSLLSAYASMSTSIMLFRTMFNQLFPRELRRYVVDAVRFYWKPKSSKLTLVFEEKDGLTINHMFDAAEAFICTKINPDSERLRITKNVKENYINIKFAESEEVVDSFEGIPVTWRYVRQNTQQNHGSSGDGDGKSSSSGGFYLEKKYIELKFDKKYKEIIISSYLPFIIRKSKELENQKKVVKLHDLQSYRSGPGAKDSVDLDHPSTFDTLAMDPKMKKAIIDDLDLFLRRRDFYKRVGKAWKRGYLLYGPPGTGKSSLIAAIANYLKFDIYDLQLMNVGSDSGLKKLMLRTSNRSILVIEDIDCSIQLPDRKGIPLPSRLPEPKPTRDPQFSLSGLLNFIDGLWSCCGDERIIIFTTNHKERLDPALLRPGRMDVHIHMSYLTIDGFKTLAANYLNIHDHHWRFREIKELIDCNKVTPAEVAEELMKSENVEVVLEGLVNFLKRKKMEEDVINDENDKADHEAKKIKIVP
uniref:AAA-ATPase At5g17760-like n=1 Tax=Erigeron canadensis TaxID=72917 RepID=UPI001CB8F444|nr:AAA-ATPase At5g17760-like [Erigeron canadensis]